MAMKVTDELKQLREMLEQELITREQFNALRDELLEPLQNASASAAQDTDEGEGHEGATGPSKPGHTQLDTRPSKTRAAHNGPPDDQPITRATPASREQAETRIAPSNPEAQECPRCASSVPMAAIVCSSCQFRVHDYRENLRRAKSSTVQKIQYTQADVVRQIKASSKAAAPFLTGCAAPLLLIGSTACLIFIPVFGFIFAVPFSFAGLLFLFAPVQGTVLFERLFDRKAWEKSQATARSQLDFLVTHLSCPSCGHSPNEQISWPPAANPKFYDCRSCGSRSYLLGRKLLYVPNPDVFLKAIDEFLNAGSRATTPAAPRVSSGNASTWSSTELPKGPWLQEREKTVGGIRPAFWVFLLIVALMAAFAYAEGGL